MEVNGSDRPLVQWSFLQYKKGGKNTIAPIQSFLHSTTQIGSKLLVFGGCDYNGDAQSQLLIYDTTAFQWSSPGDATDYQEDHPGARYGHTATLVEMHPPKIMVYGGMIAGGTFEFDAPDGVDTPGPSEFEDMGRSLMAWRKKGQKSVVEDSDENVYFLTLNAEHWTWSKPIVNVEKSVKPPPRAEHSACKTGTNEVTIFGGWSSQPCNDMWTFNYVDMEWKPTVSSGIQPRPRYRHTAEVVGLKMYVLGGSDNNEDVSAGAVYLGIHELSLETMQWSHPTISGANPFPRSGHSSAVIGAQSVAIFGGKKDNEWYCNDIVLLDLEHYVATTVNVVENQLPMPVSNCTITAVGNKCFVFGGTDVKGACYNDIRSLDVGYYLSATDITVGEGASSEYSFKILIIGDAAVGKSALLTRFSENAFLHNYSSTIGIDFNSRMIRVDHSICKLEIWDTAGQERFSTITANYYRGAQGALLVYDVTRRDSYEHVQKWYDRAKQLGGEHLETVLVGNKIDLPLEDRQVTTPEGEALAAELQIPFLETSALNGSNVENTFVRMTQCIKRSLDKRGLTGVKATNMRQAGGVQLASKERGMTFSDKCGCVLI
mmetsp:Transcript_24814/g.41342  ORF Transcript_24814/g.41342 Transcript_24814/m.41342 type:complete len:601 (+) Transcript_24814:73-1875(+)